ncbi:hypothetical protein NM688_g5618 [Phlebia brevispora]|uniref:Uncharacterized protein n=1 Tax=Phlebia brevispora TaxID=194682 RepID=A0ACC1SSC6_9APHY|nr:hypothetical protein NM688_g5618 [Phlebia brevispora]
MLSISYGYDVYRDTPADGASLLDRAFVVMDEFADALLPGAFLVDTIPLLRYAPSWFPGAQWKCKIAGMRARLLAVTDDALAFTKKRSNKTERGSLEMEDIIKWTGVSLLGGAHYQRLAALLSLLRPEAGGTDTDCSSSSGLLVIDTDYTDPMELADTFDAHRLLPGHDAPSRHSVSRAGGDRQRRGPRQAPNARRQGTPALRQCALQGAFAMAAGCAARYRGDPSFSCVPHRLREDDEYEGHFLPKDSLVIVNSWGLLHDPARYTDPAEFKPERFLKDKSGRASEEDPHNIVFGFGRRSCPGHYVADAMIFIIAANVLAAFDISAPVENGVPVLPMPEQSSSIISHPLPFNCTIKPRSANAEAIVRAAMELQDTEHVML